MTPTRQHDRQQQRSSPPPPNNRQDDACHSTLLQGIWRTMAQVEDSLNVNPLGMVFGSAPRHASNQRQSGGAASGTHRDETTPSHSGSATQGSVALSSIGSTLSSLRTRLNQLLGAAPPESTGDAATSSDANVSDNANATSDHDNSSSDANMPSRCDNADTHGNNNGNGNVHEDARELSSRLEMAELAHSTRTPLIQLRSALEHRRNQSSQSLSSLRPSPTPATDRRQNDPNNMSTATLPETSPSGPFAARRRPSQTMASRTRVYPSMASTPSDMEQVLEESEASEHPSSNTRTRPSRQDSPPRQRRRRGSIGNPGSSNSTSAADGIIARNTTESSVAMSTDERIHRKFKSTLEYLSEDEDAMSTAKASTENGCEDDDQHHKHQPEIEVILPPVLMSQSSSESLADDHRSILFGSSATSSIADNMSTGDEEFYPLVYSWGVDENMASQSLHDDETNAIDDNASNGDNGDDVSKALKPVSVSDRIGRTHVVTASASHKYSAVVTRTGTVMTCGSNEFGTVDPNRPTTAIIPRPTVLETIQVPILQVSCGFDHVAALTNTGTVLTWGNNAFGQLGHRNALKSDDGKSNSIRTPQIMSLGPRRAAAIACGEGFTLVLTSRMQLLACGIPSIAGYKMVDSQSADGMAVSTSSSSSSSSCQRYHALPTSLPTLFGLPIVQIAAGRQHAIVITSNGRAFAWGDNEYGQCGREYPKRLNASPIAIRLPALSTMNNAPDNHETMPTEDSWIVGVACGDAHSILVTKSGAAFTFGNNVHGQLGVRAVVDGNGDCDNEQGDAQKLSARGQIHRVDHPEHGEFVAAAAGEFHTMFLDSDANVWVCGKQQRQSASKLTRVLANKSIATIASGGNHCIAIGSVPTSNMTAIPPPLSPTKRQLSNLLQNSIAATSTVPTTVSTVSRPTVETTMEELVTAVDRELIMPSTDNSSRTVSKPIPPAAKELAERAQELFKTPAVLNSLFWEPSNLDVLYDKLISSSSDSLPVRQAIASSIEKGMMEGLLSLEEESGRLCFFESVRFLLLYLQCPLFMQGEDQGSNGNGDEASSTEEVTAKKQAVVFDRRGDLMLLLCETFLGLSYEGYQAMVSWVTTLYPREYFVKFLIQPLLHQLKRGLDPNAGPTQRLVPLVTTVLKWLYITSERAGNIVRPEDFYSTAVENRDMQCAYTDLRLWKNTPKSQRSSNFYLCSHGFLFSPSSKRNLLCTENQMEMLSSATRTGVSYDASTQTLHVNIDPYFVVEVEREKLLEQTLRKISTAKPTDLRKKLRIKFKDEEGVDAGGVTREFFQLLSTKLFDVSSGMWTDRYGDGVTWFNSDCFWNDEGYYLVGILVGLAVYNNVLLDVHFPKAVYRKLLGMPLGLEDLMDEDLKRNFQALLDFDASDSSSSGTVEDIFCLNFDLQWHDLGSAKVVELKPGGSDVAVTAENREEYVQLYVKFLLEDSIHPQYEAFERGFMKVMSNSTLDFMSPGELELLVVGTPDLNFDALRSKTTYEGGYDKDSKVIQHFWQFIQSAPQQTQKQFLKFATGTDRAPIGGLGSMAFKIQRAGPDSMQLPTSHTCFNTLLLPDYGDDYEKLKERLGRAVLECEGFGLQ